MPGRLEKNVVWFRSRRYVANDHQDPEMADADIVQCQHFLRI